MTVNESGIYFFPGGGHNHDGENSSLVDTSAYSIFDFEWAGFIGTPSRIQTQTYNYNSFKNLIIETVNQSVLAPANIILQPGTVNGTAHIIASSITGELISANTISANNILAGTITANELAANIVLVNNVIRSNNFDGTIASNGVITSSGNTGWAITYAGDAVFDAADIRGAITAAAISINANNIWTSNGFILGGNTGIYTTNTGIVIGSNVTIDGNVQVSNIYIDNLNFWEPGIFQVGIDIDNRITFSNSVLEVSGVVVASAGAIGDWAIVGGELVGLSANGYATMTISASNGGTIEAGGLMIGNGDLNAEDVVATNIIRSGPNANTAIDIISRGIYYTRTSQVYNTTNYAFSFTYDGTDIYARLWDEASQQYIDICLTQCGSSGTTPDPNPTVGTVVGVGGTVVVVTEPPPVSPAYSCSPPCPEGFVCLEGNICIG